MMALTQTKSRPGQALSDEARWIGLALDLLCLCEQTDQVLRQRANLMAELVMLSKKGPQS